MELIKNLPVFQEFEKIKQKWDEKSHLILKSPTGSGKSIALPYLLKTLGLVSGKILVAQPRRIAARLLAKQLAVMANWQEGKQVGYQVRFEKKYCEKTEIIYATDGIVLNKLLDYETLGDVEVLILDEFHERSAQLDLCLALALKLWENKRRKLRLVVTSATLDIDKLARHIPDSAWVELSDRSYPVEVEYRTPKKDYPAWKSVVEVMPTLLQKMEGDILVFMDGAYEISHAVNSILSSTWSRGLEVRPLYGDLSPEKQDLALSNTEKRKIIISTNIAETSLTIEGIKIVIDTGKAKKMRYDSVRGVNALLSEPISKSSADQRAGRAGRLGPGFCLRIWSESEHETRPEFDIPEILSIDLCEIYLNLAGVGLSLEQITFIEPISENSICAAKEKLKSLGAINSEENLPEHGIKMSELPTHPSWAHALLIAKRKNIVPSIALILAMLEGRPIVRPDMLEDFFPLRSPRSDIYCLLLAFEEGERRSFSIQDCKKIGVHAGRCREAEQLARELCNLVGVGYRLELPDYRSLAEALILCFPNKIAHLVSDGRNIYEDFAGRRLHLSKHSVLGSEKFVLPLQVVEKKIKNRIVLQMEWTSGLDEEWIRNILGSKIITSTNIVWDPLSRKVMKRKTESWGKLILSISESEDVSKKDRAKGYAGALVRGDLKLKNWNARVENFLNRQSFLAANYPELGIVEMDNDTQNLFLEELCQSGSSWKEIRNLEVYEPLLNCCSKEERETLEHATPETFDLGMGKRPYTLDYSQKKEVVLRAILQDLYDVKTHPTIVFGKYPLVVEILAPNRRPVQRTSNLLSFWEGSYPEVRKDLAGRYPKHEWR
ncbi:MAG TPA: hypothetical protein DCL00_01670 [Opitutae bacterium]|nr:hypothetical protein [Opitutae bacterium]